MAKQQRQKRYLDEWAETWLRRSLPRAFLLPSLIALLAVLFTPWSALLKGVIIALFLTAGIFGYRYLHRKLVDPLRTLSTLIGSLKEGDLGPGLDIDAYGPEFRVLLQDIQALRQTLSKYRVGEAESTALLQRVMAEIQVVLVAFDENGVLRWCNRWAETLLQIGPGQMGKSAEALGLNELMEGPYPRISGLQLGGRLGRWDIRTARFREDGKPRRLFILSDLTTALRAEERQAWHRLLKVVRHEIRNSLTPILSLTDTARETLIREAPQGEWRDDIGLALEIIESRAAAIRNLLSAYADVQELPSPRFAELDPGTIARRAVEQELRLPVVLELGPDIHFTADADQIDRALVNLIGNAVEVCREQEGCVRLTWICRDHFIEFQVWDEGEGFTDESERLFVPFYTTKKDGSGLGLFVVRQIAESHGGSILLENRQDRSGCVARLRLPLQSEVDDRS